MSTDAFKEEIQKVSSKEVAVIMMELTPERYTDTWTEPMRICGNTSAITHDSNTYEPYGLTFTAPQTGTGDYTATIVIEDITRVLTSKFGSDRGNITIEVFVVLASNPDEVELGPWELYVKTVKQSSYKLTLSLEKVTILENSLDSFTVSSGDFPGAWL